MFGSRGCAAFHHASSRPNTCCATPCCRRSPSLAIQLGLLLSGSILAEILFQYPGVGLLLYPRRCTENDYNLLLGTIELSIIAVAGATLLIDLAYPLIDPRIRRT